MSVSATSRSTASPPPSPGGKKPAHQSRHISPEVPLVGSLYILDEPSIGLHSRDTRRLIGVLRKLQQTGNTVVIVEHDEDIMLAADEIVDIGPDAGRLGAKWCWMEICGKC